MTSSTPPHCFPLRSLRRHAEIVGLQSNFTIIDVDDQLRLLKQLIAAANLDEKRWPARALAGCIDRWKNRGWTPEQIDAGESELFAAGRGAEQALRGVVVRDGDIPARERLLQRRCVHGGHGGVQ